MLDNRSLKLDLCALALAALVVFLGISLWTYVRFDPPSSLAYPPAEMVQNACGQAGALTAHYLFSSVGYGAYYLVGSLAIVTVFLLARREVDQPILRTVGWVVSLIGVTTLAALVAPNWTPGPLVGSGGYVGAMGRGFLEMHFATAGAFIFALSVLAAGLLLATDYFLFRVAATTTAVSGRSLMHLSHLGPAGGTKNSRRVKTDLEDEFEDEEADDEDEWEYEEEDADGEYEYEDDEDEVEADEDREIKVRTPADKAEDADEEEDEEDDEVTSWDEEESDGTASKLASGLKSALGITNRRQQPAKQSAREEVIEQLEAADQMADQEIAYELPPLDLLLPNDEICYEEHEKEVRRKAKVLEKTFKNFGFNVRVVEIETGPVIAQYEVELEAGLRLAKISGLADDLAIALRVPSVRIVAPIPGKNTVGIEVPNENRQLVRLREVIEETNGRAKRMKIPVYIGKDVAGNPMTVDLTSLPHLLIAGRTGTGKSVCLNSIIVSILMSRGPDEVRMLMIDPKMVELSGYAKLPHLMHPVVTDMRKAEAILAWAVDKMEERYQLLSRAGVRHVSVYNQLGEDELRERVQPASDEEWRQVPRQLPYIVIVADELADLMMTSGKDVEQHIIRLAQKSRAVGIHLILATQKPTVDVITGLIKSNLPARIAFQVASRTDSRVVLDEMGAEKLLGDGDMLFLQPGTSLLLRGQGTFLSDDEITEVVDFVGTDDPQFAGELMQLKTKEEIEAAGANNFSQRDELYEAAVDIVVRERRGSCSLLQRALGIGYGRAARLIDFMAEDSIVGQYNGSQAREVLISVEDWEIMSRAGNGEEGSEAATDEDAPWDSAEATPAGAGVAGAPHFKTVAATSHNGQSSRTVATLAEPRPRRRNRIVPEPDEVSNVDDEFDDEEESFDEETLTDEDWDDEDETAEAVGDDTEADDDADVYDESEYEDDELENGEEYEDEEEAEYEDDDYEDAAEDEDEDEEAEEGEDEYEDDEYEEEAEDDDDEYEEVDADEEWDEADEGEEDEWEEEEELTSNR